MKYRILYKNQKYYPQYRYTFWLFWFYFDVNYFPGCGSSCSRFDDEKLALRFIKDKKEEFFKNSVRKVIEVD